MGGVQIKTARQVRVQYPCSCLPLEFGSGYMNTGPIQWSKTKEFPPTKQTYTCTHVYVHTHKKNQKV